MDECLAKISLASMIATFEIQTPTDHQKEIVEKMAALAEDLIHSMGKSNVH